MQSMDVGGRSMPLVSDGNPTQTVPALLPHSSVPSPYVPAAKRIGKCAHVRLLHDVSSISSESAFTLNDAYETPSESRRPALNCHPWSPDALPN